MTQTHTPKVSASTAILVNMNLTTNNESSTSATRFQSFKALFAVVDLFVETLAKPTQFLAETLCTFLRATVLQLFLLISIDFEQLVEQSLQILEFKPFNVNAG